MTTLTYKNNTRESRNDGEYIWIGCRNGLDTVRTIGLKDIEITADQLLKESIEYDC